MNQKNVLWLVIATALVLLGGVLFSVAMWQQNWNFSGLSTAVYETNEFKTLESFENIVIVTNTADIQLIPADTASVTCYEQENAKHTVSVRDGTLYIEVKDETKWYQHIGINFSSPKIQLYIPKGQYGSIRIKGDTGDVSIPGDFSFASLDVAVDTGDVSANASVAGNATIRTTTGAAGLENASVGALSISVSTGRVTVSNVACAGDLQVRVSTGKANLTNVTCQNLHTTGDTGDLSLKAVIAVETMTIERSTGDVTFDRCDAAHMTVVTDTGDVTGTLVTPKLFFCETDTGRVDVPKSTTGGTCEIRTDTGSIKIKIAN